MNKLLKRKRKKITEDLKKTSPISSNEEKNLSEEKRKKA